MKKILSAAFFVMSAAIAMEKKEAQIQDDTPFTQEGFVDPDDAVLVPGKAIWNFYDGGGVKHMLNPNLNALITKYLVTIIRKKCGSNAAVFFQNNPDDARSAIMSRYSKAVCWQVQKYHNDTTDIPSVTLEKAERQVPFALEELIYIEQNIKCYGSYENPNIKQALRDLKSQPQQANRDYLNNLLKNIASSLEEKKVT